MANPIRFRKRRRQAKGGATLQSTFFRSAGNERTNQGESPAFFNPAFVQTKLTVNQPGDAHEREADAMAEHVVQRAAQKQDEFVQRKDEEQDKVPLKAEQEEAKVQKKSDPEEEKEALKKSEEAQEKKEEAQPKEAGTLKLVEKEKKVLEKEEEQVAKKAEEEKPIQKKVQAGPAKAPAAVPVSTQQLKSTQGQGSQLPTATRTEMSQAFGYDFSNVRIHTSSQAERLSQDLHAQAFTHGADVYFNAGKYNPETTEGKRLLAHELTHVVQQNASAPEALQRYPVPGNLPCADVPDWLDNHSPYAPEWAETRCTYAFNGRLRIQFQTLPDGTVQATASGSPALSVSKACPIDGPNWSPSARPNRAAEVAAWHAMKATLNAHEQQHRQIGEQQRLVLQANYRAIDITVTGTDRADAVAQIQQQVNALQQQWMQAAQSAQDAIDPFRVAILDCPPQTP